MAYGTMVKLDASEGTIDTSDNLTLFGAFDKGIVLNGANKKVYNPVDSKIATDAVGTHPPDFETLLTGGTSGAKMVTQYITTLTGACTIYGRKTTDATFTSGETVTGTDGDGNSISFVLNANEVAPPHWYDYGVWGGSSTFGVMPDKLYLGALYLGRAYLAGDPNSPRTWIASRQGNIHDLMFNKGDVQSACAGSDIEFGKLSDVPRTLIPYENDYMLFGCRRSIYALIGDPMQGGSGKRVSDKVGVFGNDAWCFDEVGNLYFWGNGGIYVLHAGLQGMENLTEYNLPKLVHDEQVDPSTHRICMEYDTKRHGILVSIVNYTTRANSCYWYEQRFKSWWSYSLPTSCSPYALKYYEASTVDNRDLLIGCSDGYIRRPDETQKNDDTGASEVAVDSYVTFGPYAMNKKIGGDGEVASVEGILACGATDGSETDSSDVDYYIFIGDSPGEVLEKVYANSYDISGTLSAPGYQVGAKQRKKTRGKYFTLMLRNNTADETWGFEEVEIDILPVGSLR